MSTDLVVLREGTDDGGSEFIRVCSLSRVYIMLLQINNISCVITYMIHGISLRGWWNSVGTRIDVFWPAKAYHMPQFPGRKRGHGFIELENCFNSIPPTSHYRNSVALVRPNHELRTWRFGSLSQAVGPSWFLCLRGKFPQTKGSPKISRPGILSRLDSYFVNRYIFLAICIV